jgi:hypothetical protein
VLNYANPKVEKEIARRWRRNRLRQITSTMGAILTGILLLAIYLYLRIVLGIRICILPF